MPADTRDKVIGQFKLRVNGLLGGLFDLYGLGIHIPEATEEIKKHSLEMHNRLSRIEDKHE